MSKKLMMNNYSENNDVIVLCKDFSPNGQPFILWENQMIDWDKYELYINVDMTNITKEWQHILAISIDNVTSWTGTKLHIYGSPNKIRFQSVFKGSGNASDFSIVNYDKTNLELVFNKNGIYIQNILYAGITYGYIDRIVNAIKQSDNIIGAADSNDLPVSTYNLVQLQPYQERR